MHFQLSLIPLSTSFLCMTLVKVAIMVKFSRLGRVVLLISSVFFAMGAFANEHSPYLAFSDLISGPSTGLGDNLGSGVIVTIWAQNAKAAEGDRQLIFRDSNNKLHEPYIYYWKAADGKLPSGPADLDESHKMTEIAFSVPQAPIGDSQIFIKVDGKESNHLPFSVRAGKIYHVKSTGSSGNDGSWAMPWRNPSVAVNKAPSGSTIYIHDVDTGNFSDPGARGIYWNNAKAASTSDSQFAIVAYPGFQPKVIAQKAIENYKTSGMVISKLDIYASNYLNVDENGQPFGKVIQSSPGDTYGIQTSRFGRIVANKIGDIPGGCASKWNGAINGNRSRVEDVKIFGNEVYDYGCNGTSKFHHTTYLSVRSGNNMIVDAWEWGYNYLHGNKAKFGIHNYDEGAGCGDLRGDLRIHDNVIVDQAGAGISVGSSCGWSMDVIIENNILVNVGLAADWDGVNPDTSEGPENGGIALRDYGLTGKYYIRNNLIYQYTADGQTVGGRGCLNFNGGADNIEVFWNNNICFTNDDIAFIGSTDIAKNKLDNVSGSNNVWYYSGKGGSEARVPSWDSAPLTSDPQFEMIDMKMVIRENSPLLGVVDNNSGKYSKSNYFSSRIRDIYGVRRPPMGSVGPVEGSGVVLDSKPMPPWRLNIQ